MFVLLRDEKKRKRMKERKVKKAKMLKRRRLIWRLKFLKPPEIPLCVSLRRKEHKYGNETGLQGNSEILFWGKRGGESDVCARGFVPTPATL